MEDSPGVPSISSLISFSLAEVQNPALEENVSASPRLSEMFRHSEDMMRRLGYITSKNLISSSERLSTAVPVSATLRSSLISPISSEGLPTASSATAASLGSSMTSPRLSSEGLSTASSESTFQNNNINLNNNKTTQNLISELDIIFSKDFLLIHHLLEDSCKYLTTKNPTEVKEKCVRGLLSIEHGKITAEHLSDCQTGELVAKLRHETTELGRLAGKLTSLVARRLLSRQSTRKSSRNSFALSSRRKSSLITQNFINENNVPIQSSKYQEDYLQQMLQKHPYRLSTIVEEDHH